MVNQFALPIALGAISWMIYVIYLAVCLCEAVYYHFLMVEAKGRMLKELNEIFKGRNPCHASLLKKEKPEEAVAQVREVKDA